jgi:hypothetical protein
VTGPTLDLTITIGDISVIASLVVAVLGAYYGIIAKISELKTEAKHTLETVTAHSEKLGEHENRLIDVIRDLAGVMGRMEISAERRARSRS